MVDAPIKPEHGKLKMITRPRGTYQSPACEDLRFEIVPTCTYSPATGYPGEVYYASTHDQNRKHLLKPAM